MTDLRPGSPEPLGLTLDHEGANVAVWAPSAVGVDLCLFESVNGKTVERRIALPERTHGVWHGYVGGLRAGTQYGFRAHGSWDPAHGSRFNPAKLLQDPYARAITGELSLNPAIYGHLGDDDLVRSDVDSAPFVPRSVAVDGHFDWQGDRRPNIPWDDTIFYETHVRGISMKHPDVPAEIRGSYLGMADPAIINHLVSLGITSVELLPVHQSVNEVHLMKDKLTNYWGYNTLGWFAPHEAYATAPGRQVDEFKVMVRALHAAGLEVILDVVYNHSAEAGERGPTLSLRGLANTGYYRTTGGGRYYPDVTGCGNSVNLGEPAVMRMVLDSMRHWVEEYHVDGFRVDLATELARVSSGDVDMAGPFMAAIAQDPVLRNVKLIAEPWDLGFNGYQVGGFPSPWAEWNGKYRDCLRDWWRGAAGVSELGWRLSGSADVYAVSDRRPQASVNFITAHDGFTMHDLVTYNGKHNEANLEGNRDGTDDNRSFNFGVEGETRDTEINRIRQRQVRNMLLTLMTSTGVPMLLGGDEFGRTQQGNNNGYCQDSDITWYHWDFSPWQRDLLAFTKRVIALRHAHPALRQRTFFEGRPVKAGETKDLTWFGADGNELSNEAWHDPALRCIGMFISGDVLDPDPSGKHVEDESFLLILHPADSHEQFVLPSAPFASAYRRVIDTTEATGSEAPWTDPAGATVMLAPHSAILLKVL